MTSSPQKAALLALLLALDVAPVSATDRIVLDDPDKTELEGYASRVSGRDVWYIESGAVAWNGKAKAQGLVVFHPASTHDYCIAPYAWIAGELSEGQTWSWKFDDSTRPQYRFWFQRCDQVDPESAIVLRTLLDIATLERIKAEQSHIVQSAQERLSLTESKETVASRAKLSEIDLRFDIEHGPVYAVRYMSGECSGVSVQVLLAPDEVRVLHASQIVC